MSAYLVAASSFHAVATRHTPPRFCHRCKSNEAAWDARGFHRLAVWYTETQKEVRSCPTRARFGAGSMELKRGSNRYHTRARSPAVTSKYSSHGQNNNQTINPHFILVCYLLQPFRLTIKGPVTKCDNLMEAPSANGWVVRKCRRQYL